MIRICLGLVFIIALAGCSATGTRTITNYGTDGKVVSVVEMPWDARIATVEAQKQADFDYYHQKPIKIRLDTMQRVRALEFHYPKTRQVYAMPKSDIEVLAEKLNPANILGIGMGMTIYKQASVPTTHTNVNAAGDATYSAPEQHDNINTQAPVMPDKSTHTTTTDIKEDVGNDKSTNITGGTE